MAKNKTPAPGDSRALVLPTATDVPDQPASPGVRAATSLLPFLDAKEYAAIAIVHGSGKRANTAFSLCKDCLGSDYGAVWMADGAIRDALASGEGADEIDAATLRVLRAMLKPKTGYVITFFNVKNRKAAGAMKGTGLRFLKIRKKLIEAGKA